MAKMQHRYRFFVKDNVIFDIPSSVYDESSVEAWQRAITKSARELDQWVILSIPDVTHTITANAAKTMKANLNGLADNGCKGLLILTSTVTAKIFAHALHKDDGGLYIEGDDSIETLCQRAQSLLGSEGILNMVVN